MKVVFTVVLLAAAWFIGILVYAKSHDMGFLETAGLLPLRQWATATATNTSSDDSDDDNISTTGFTNEEITAMKQRLSPRELLIHDDDHKLSPHQFLHLHHMKTGGTSMDGLIQCGMKRLQRDYNKVSNENDNNNNNGGGGGLIIPYFNVHECSVSRYEQCRSGADQRCLTSIQEAAILSYCAPLADLPTFQWINDDSSSSSSSSSSSNQKKQQQDDFSAVTVLRHPVNRVWSMYRFRTKGCYQCRTLKDVYEAIDNGTDDETSMCASQLLNHQTRNLASSSSVNTNTTAHELNQYHAQEAISNLKHLITMVGITEDMEFTAKIVSYAFPWLAENVTYSKLTCPMPRSNTSPSNNGCGPGGTHMPLPDHPDEETARLIEEHNQLDLQVYEAGLKHFELQKVALGLV